MQVMGDTAFLAIDLFGLLLIIVVFGYQIYIDRRGQPNRTESRRASPVMRMRRNIPASKLSACARGMPCALFSLWTSIWRKEAKARVYLPKQAGHI
jgi:hypothetical protein